MSTKNSQRTVATASSLVMKPDKSTNAPHHKVGIKLLGVGFFSLMLVVLIVAGGIWLAHGRNKTNTKHTNGSAEQAVQLTPYETASKQASDGDYAKAQQTLSKSAAQATTKQDRAKIYGQQAALALSYKNYTDASMYAQKAEALLHNAATASQLATIAIQQGDNTAARKYLNLAISRQDTSTPQGSLIARDLQQKLQELGQ